MNTPPPDTGAYLATLPGDARATIDWLCRTTRTLVPEAAESISYGLPAFKYRGRPLVYFGAAKNHCAIYGTDPGTIRFPISEPPTEATLVALLTARIAAIESALARPKKPRTST
ncbi:MAG: iron chaperone [Tepidiformaceae bacterium]